MKGWVKVGEKNPPTINPIADFVVGLAMGQSPLDKVGKGIKDIKDDAKAITDISTAISELNGTLAETNEILRAILIKFG